MEDIENEINAPDENGVLDLSHQTWVHLDAAVWNNGRTLLILNASYNAIEDIPSAVGELKLLRELHLDHNRIESLPSSIGLCVQLRVLNLEANRLERVPTELSHCLRLSEVYLGHNELTEIPAEFNKLQELRLLDVQDNKLEELPETLCECKLLDTLICRDNESLKQVPPELRETTKLVLWICEKTKQHSTEVAEYIKINQTLEDMAKVSDREKFELKDEILKLQNRIRDLEQERPYHYLNLKSKVNSCVSKCVIS